MFQAYIPQNRTVPQLPVKTCISHMAVPACELGHALLSSGSLERAPTSSFLFSFHPDQSHLNIQISSFLIVFVFSHRTTNLFFLRVKQLTCLYLKLSLINSPFLTDSPYSSTWKHVLEKSVFPHHKSFFSPCPSSSQLSLDFSLFPI